MNGSVLKGKMREKDLTQEAVATKIGLSLSRFNAKLNNTGGAEFSLGEIRALKELFSLDSIQTDQIFFS